MMTHTLRESDTAMSSASVATILTRGSSDCSRPRRRAISSAKSDWASAWLTSPNVLSSTLRRARRGLRLVGWPAAGDAAVVAGSGPAGEGDAAAVEGASGGAAEGCGAVTSFAAEFAVWLIWPGRPTGW